MTTLDQPTFGNMVNKYAAARRIKAVESPEIKTLGDVLENLRNRAMPAKIVRYEEARLEPEYREHNFYD